MWWIFVIIGVLFLLIALFAAFIGISLTLGMRNHRCAKYNPLTNHWYELFELSEE